MGWCQFRHPSTGVQWRCDGAEAGGTRGADFGPPAALHTGARYHGHTGNQSLNRRRPLLLGGWVTGRCESFRDIILGKLGFWESL